MGEEDANAPIPELVQLGERLGRARREQGLTWRTWPGACDWGPSS